MAENTGVSSIASVSAHHDSMQSTLTLLASPWMITNQHCTYPWSFVRLDPKTRATLVSPLLLLLVLVQHSAA